MTTATETQDVLTARAVTKRFGGLVAVNNVDFTVGKNEIVGLIGPNGAGKTTFFNCLTGMVVPSSGLITYQDKPVFGGTTHWRARLLNRDARSLAPNQITQIGIARTFQNIRLFPNMTVLENVLVGRHCRTREGVFSAIGRGPNFHRTERETRERARELLAFVNLKRDYNDLARNLAYGDQRRLEIARALATGPKLLALDEPAAGFNPAEKSRLMDLIRKVRDQGYTVLLIEHDMRLVMGVTDRIVVLEFGRKIAEGSPAEIRDNPAVIAAYLGVDEDDAS
jgi:branched-chain amino acid transport system ATP-binding protein